MYVAVIVDDAVVATELLVTVKVPEVALAGTLTLGGTVAADRLLLDNVTTAPPAGAPRVSVTVPVEFPAPPVTLVGFRLTEEMLDVPDCSGPTVVVGSTDAYWRTRTLLKFARVLVSPYSAMPPEGKVASEV